MPAFTTYRARPIVTRVKIAVVDNVRNLSLSVVVVRSKAINHLHLAVVLMSTVGLSSLFSFISRTRLAYDVSTNLELAS